MKMKKIAILVLLMVVNIYAQKIDNHSVLVDNSEIIESINSTKKSLDTYEKKDKIKYQDKINNYEKELYSLENTIKPFSLSKWHITPLEALKEICLNDAIKQIGFSYFSDKIDRGGTPNRYINKQEICSNLTMDNVQKYLNEGSIPRSMWKDYNILNVGNEKYIMGEHEIHIFAKDININNLSHQTIYSFITNKDINAYLLMNNKEKSKSFYLLNDKKQVNYGYFGLYKVAIYSNKSENLDILKVKFNDLKDSLAKKYEKYHIENNDYFRGYKIGHFNTANLKLESEFGSDYLIEYKYDLKYGRTMFSDYYTKLLKEIENSKKSPNDAASKL